MRYFVPKLAPGWIEDGPQSQRADHLGGWPWGLPVERWPVCRHCGAAMSFVCQLAHDPDRLELGGEGRVLFVFWCLRDPGTCAVWEPDAGSNAVIVLKPEERTDAPSEVAEVALLPYLQVLGWSEQDDGVAAEQAPEFFDEARYLALEDDSFRVMPGTRLGGAPFWPQATPVCEADPEWRLALQLDGGEWLASPAPSADILGCTVHFQHDDGSHSQVDPLTPKTYAPRQGVLVVDDGSWCVDRFSDFTVYVFLRRGHDSAQGRLCMQR